MANGGAFGNPLTTGIALNFEVDMTPYRQMMRDNLQFAQTQAAERKKKEKEFQNILKNVAYDDSKIHQRMRDDARNEYAATINDVIELNKKNDYGGIMNRIAKFDSKLNNYVDATSNFRAYEKASDDGKSWVDMNYINAYNNPEKFDDSYLIENFSDVALYDKDAGVFSAQSIPKQDEVAFVNKYMQGMKDQFMRDDEGKIKRSGFLSETGDYAYLKSKSQDPESFYQELGIAWLGGGANNVEHMRRKLGLKPEDLEGSIDTPSGPMAKSAYYATEFMKGVAEPKMYSEELRRPAKEGGGGFSFSMGSGRSEGSIFNKSGGRELKLKGGNVLNTKGQYDVTFTKGTGRTTMSVPSGSYELDPTTGEYKPTSFTGALDEAIPLYPMVGEDNQEWYVATSKGSVSDVDPNLVLALINALNGGDPGEMAQAQQMLDKEKYGKTYLIKGNESVRNQFWQKILGQDHTKQRAANAMKELGKSEDRLGLGI